MLGLAEISLPSQLEWEAALLCVAVLCFLHTVHYFSCSEGRQSCCSSWFVPLCFLPSLLVAIFSIPCFLWVAGVEKGTWEECSRLLNSSGQRHQRCLWGECGKKDKRNCNWGNLKVKSTLSDGKIQRCYEKCHVVPVGFLTVTPKSCCGWNPSRYVWSKDYNFLTVVIAAQ